MDGPARVAVIDDEPANVELVKRALRRAYTVEGYLDPVQALEAITKDPPDVILSDFRMPRMHGVALLLALKERGVTCPAFLVTGYAQAEDVLRAFEEGVVRAVIAKPFSVKDLVERVAEALADPAGP